MKYKNSNDVFVDQISGDTKIYLYLVHSCKREILEHIES